MHNGNQVLREIRFTYFKEIFNKENIDTDLLELEEIINELIRDKQSILSDLDMYIPISKQSVKKIVKPDGDSRFEIESSFTGYYMVNKDFDHDALMLRLTNYLGLSYTSLLDVYTINEEFSSDYLLNIFFDKYVPVNSHIERLIKTRFKQQ